MIAGLSAAPVSASRRAPGAVTDTPAGRWLVCLLAWAFVVWTCVRTGKDLNWDSLNYHLYAGFAALNDRFDLDFMAAGMTGYFNPYAFVPLYLMVAADWPAIAIGVVLASLHAVALWCVFGLARVVLPAGPPGLRALATVAAVVFAVANPVFLQEAGSTFSDALVATPVIAGWWLVARVLRGPADEPGWVDRHRSVALGAAGWLLGAAASLKLSNVMFAAALLPAVMVVPGAWRDRGRAFAAYAIGGVLAAAMIAGPWAWKLWLHLGNPLFPFFNGLFRSPDFIVEPIQHLRFVPDTLADGLLRPFRMVIPARMVHTEPTSPDLRYAVLLLALAAVALQYWRRSRRSPSPGRDAGTGPAAATAAVPAVESVAVERGAVERGAVERADGASAGCRRARLALTACFAIAWTLWLSSSGNSRYFLPMAGVAAPLLAAWLIEACGGAARRAAVVLVAVMLAQGTHLNLTGEARWSATDWDGRWFDVDLPPRLASRPFLYLSVDPNSGSVLAPFLPAGSGMMNVSGSYALGPGAPGGEHARRLIAGRAGELRSLQLVAKERQDGVPILPDRRIADTKLVRFGLRTDPSDCELISLRGNGVFVASIEIDGVTPQPHRVDTRWLSCAVVADGVDVEAYEAERRRIDVVFERLEAACPRLFAPRGTLTELDQSAWRRMYVNRDLSVWVGPERVRFFNAAMPGDPVDLGTVADWLAGPQPIDCSRRYAKAFGLLDLRP